MKTTILIVEDDLNLGHALKETIELEDFSCVWAKTGSKAIELIKKYDFQMIVSDVQLGDISGIDVLKFAKSKMSDTPVVLITAFGSIKDAVTAMQIGANDYLVKPFPGVALIRLIEKYALSLNENITQSKTVMIDEKSINLFAMAKKVANSEISVLLNGESGVGKEVVAKYIHDNSNRKNNAFIAINCAAIPDNMLEATLFGYEKGAFTGAHKSTPGKFELAQNGTLLLDEISEMPLNLQAKLLRVIQEKEVERLGANKLINLDVRIIATTNRDLSACVKAGDFREDLFYRLNVFPLKILALRERTADIIPLANYFLKRYNSKDQYSFSQEATLKLKSYSWPGNIRELENVVQRAIILANNHIITDFDIAFEEKDDNITHRPETDNGNLQDRLKNKEFDEIMAAIVKAGGSKSKAALSLGISPRTLRHKIAKLKCEGFEF